MGQIGVPAAIVSIVAVMVVPLPASVLDLLLVVNLAGAVMILLSTMFVQKALDYKFRRSHPGHCPDGSSIP